MCTVSPSHSKWLSEQGNESASNFTFIMNIPLQKVFGSFRRPQLWAIGDWQLHHNNMPIHTSCLVQSFFVKHQITQGTQLPHSPDLVPCDLWVFPKLKSPLKGKRFQTVDEIQESITGKLMVIGRTVWGPKVPTLKGAKVSVFLCMMFFGSCIFSKCLQFSYYMSGYLLDRPLILWV